MPTQDATLTGQCIEQIDTTRLRGRCAKFAVVSESETVYGAPVGLSPPNGNIFQLPPQAANRRRDTVGEFKADRSLARASWYAPRS